MQTIGEFELCDFGIEHSQYFQGIGVSFSEFTDCAYGIGDNPREALDDCLEQIAQQGFDTDDLEKRICSELGFENLDAIPDSPSVQEELGDNPEWIGEDGELDLEDCELHYHFGVRWVAESPNLDCSWPDDLDAYSLDDSNPLVLRQYASIKARAIDARLAGNIGRALVLESVCEEKYSLLPQAMRW